MKRSIFRVPIVDVKYKTVDRIIKCKITWINPVSGGNQTSVGVARCNSDDEFDEVKGKRLAESRAKQNIYKYYAKYIREIAHLINTKHRTLYLDELTHEYILLDIV